MSIYHMSVQIIGRSSGRSSVAAAAYRSGEVLIDERQGMIHDYTKKWGIEHTAIILPENAPLTYSDRETLWNAVEKAEKEGRAQLAREVEVALPIEFTREVQLDILHRYVQENFVNHGMIADIALHDKGDGNPHAHIMLTMRPMDENGKWQHKYEKLYLCKNATGEERGFTAIELRQMPKGEWEKQLPYYKNGKGKPLYLTKHEAETESKYIDYIRVKGKKNPKVIKEPRVNPILQQWNDSNNVEIWRKQWADICNQAFEQEDIKQRVDHRSYKRQGVAKQATIHLGSAVGEMEKRGYRTDKAAYNEEVRLANAEFEKSIDDLLEQIEKLERQRKYNQGALQNNKDYKIQSIVITPREMKRQPSQSATPQHDQRSGVNIGIENTGREQRRLAAQQRDQRGGVSAGTENVGREQRRPATQQRDRRSDVSIGMEHAGREQRRQAALQHGQRSGVSIGTENAGGEQRRQAALQHGQRSGVSTGIENTGRGQRRPAVQQCDQRSDVSIGMERAVQEQHRQTALQHDRRSDVSTDIEDTGREQRKPAALQHDQSGGVNIDIKNTSQVDRQQPTEIQHGQSNDMRAEIENTNREQQPAAQDIADRLISLKSDYIRLEILIEKTRRESTDYSKKYDELDKRAASIQGKIQEVRLYEQQIERLDERRSRLGAFAMKEKRAIANEIKTIEIYKERMQNSLDAEDGAKGYEETLRELRQLQKEITTKKAMLPDIAKIEQRQASIVKIYKYERKSALQRDDREAIGELVRQRTPAYMTQDERIAASKATKAFHHSHEWRAQEERDIER